MKTWNKRGSAEESSLNWLIGTILGILLTSMVIIVGVQWYISTTKTQDSFDNLIEKIQNMEDDEYNTTTLFLPEEYILVSFVNEEEYETGNYFGDCSENVDHPESCGIHPCICMCNGNWMVDFDEACTKKAVACHPFTGEDEQWRFTDVLCGDAGLYREGTDSGIQTLYFHREGKNIQFCTTDECVTEEHQEVADAFSGYIHDYEECLEGSDSCYCNLDPTFLSGTFVSDYAITFKSNEIQLWNIDEQNILYSEDVETGINVHTSVPNRADYAGDSVTFHAFTLIEASTELEHWVIVPSTSDIETWATDYNSKQLEVSTTFLKEGDTINFVEDGYDFSTLSDCTAEEDMAGIF